jgi:hypothetical protein
MLAVTDNFKAAVNAATRNLDVVVKLIGKNETDYTNARIYSSKDMLLSLKIVDGQTTGGFSLGGTICPSLTAELHKTAVVTIGDKVKAELVVYNGGGNLTMASEFTVDNIKRKADGSLSVTALGNMIKLVKNYVSELTYPTTQLAGLEEIAEQTGFELHPLITSEMINNPVIQTAPVKGKAEDGTTLYYTRRETLGFAAAINGGAAYIDQYGRIGIARHNDTGETFTHERVLRETLTEPFTVEAVKWSSTGLSYSLGDDYNENTVEFYNPLVYNARELIAHNLETDLIGFGYDGAIIKKQGCGYFEVGDIVHYVDINNTTHDLLILGVVYEFSDGYFSETLYSLTSTPQQREYTGSSSVTTAPSAPTPIISDVLYDYVMTSDTSARCNGVTYTVEKDGTTGLITRITDDLGGELTPELSANLTDITSANTLFWAVAMSRGLERYIPKQLGIFNYAGIKGLNQLYSDILTASSRTPSGDVITVTEDTIKLHGILATTGHHLNVQALFTTPIYNRNFTTLEIDCAWSMTYANYNGSKLYVAYGYDPDTFGGVQGSGLTNIAVEHIFNIGNTPPSATRSIYTIDISNTIGKNIYICLFHIDNDFTVYSLGLKE